jgi:hypothetical protein
MTLRAPLVGWLIGGALALSLVANVIVWPVLAALVRHFNREAASVKAQADSLQGKCWGNRVLPSQSR